MKYNNYNLSGEELERVIEFYKNPSYKNLAMATSVLKVSGPKSNTDFFAESRLYTDMLLTLKGQEQEKKETVEALAQDVTQRINELLDSTFGK